MAYSTLLYEKQRQGVLITLNRPEQMNALSAELREELHQAFDEAAVDPAVRAILFRIDSRSVEDAHHLSSRRHLCGVSSGHRAHHDPQPGVFGTMPGFLLRSVRPTEAHFRYPPA